MANLITTVPSIETQEYDLYIKPLQNDPLISALPFDFVYGNMPREIFFNNNTDKITGAKSSCGWSFKGDAVTFTKKTLTPIELQAPVEQCYSVLLKKLFGDKLPDGALRGELSTEVIEFMVTQQSYGFNRDLLSILFLGDTGVAADDYYVLMNGIYAKLLAGVAAVDGTVDAGVTLNSTTLNTTDFLNTMKQVHDAQSRLLKNVPKRDKVWIWTQATYDLYIAYLQAKTQTTAGVIQTSYVTDGLEVNAFLGIPIVVLPIVDERLETDFLTGSPAAPDDPYRTILTTPSNHVILMDGTAFQNANVWYEKKEDKVYAVGSALIDYQYGYGELNVIAGLS
jgi:hypothetical protein